MAQTCPPPGWYRDPTRIADDRYWDGRAWTDTVTRAGTTMSVPIDRDQAAVPPLQGTEAPSTVAREAHATVGQPRTSPALIVLLLLVTALTVVVFIVVADGGDTSDDPPPPTMAPTTEVRADGG